MPRATKASKAPAGGPFKDAARLRCASHALFTLAVYFLDEALVGVVAIEGCDIPKWLSALLILCSGLGGATLYRRARQLEISARSPAGDKRPPQAAAAPKEQGFDRQLTKWTANLTAAGKEGNFCSAQAILKKMYQAGYKPDAFCYNCVIQACTKSREPWLAEQWVRRMEDALVEPNVVTYNLIMDYTAKACNGERTEMWLRRMCERGVSPNNVSYASVVHARAKNDELEAAEAWISEMLKAGVEPNLSCVSSIIHGYSRWGDVESAERWLSRSAEWGITPTVTTFTSLVDASAKRGDPARAEHWLERMVDAGLEPNVVTYTAIIDAYAKAEDAAGAGRWYRRMLEAGVEPNTYTWSAVINAYAKVGDVQAAEDVVEEMTQRGHPANLPAFCALLDACAKSEDAERGMRTFQRIRQSGLKPNVVAYASVARLFSRRGDWAQCEAFAEEMKTDGVAMNEYYLYTFLLSYGNARPRQCKRAEAAFREAAAAGLKMNDHVQGALRRVLGLPRSKVVIEEVTGKEMAPAALAPTTAGPRRANLAPALRA